MSTTQKHVSLREKMLYILYCFPLVGMFLYSFTQIDLSLTISRIPWLQEIVRSFQYIGYFDRPASTAYYIGLVLMLSAFYVVFLILAHKKKLHRRFVWITVITAAAVLTFSYNAFSYDLFNYIFDAKIVTQYQQNPYEHKALDYPQDPMLSFMRWTHRTYPYGPLWLGVTVPLSFIGMQLFLPTFFLFKALMGVSFLASTYFVTKIFRKFAPEREVFGLVFFGLNPLLLIESLVSAHLDIVMMVCALWAFYLLICRRYLWAWVLLAVSIGLKFITVFLIPVFLAFLIMQKAGKIWWQSLFVLASILLVISVIVVSLRTNFQPWYLVPLLSFAVFAAHRYYILLPALIVSFFALGTYVPYLYVGNWDKPIPQMLSDMYLFSYSLAFFVVAGYYFIAQVRFAKALKWKKRV